MQPILRYSRSGGAWVGGPTTRLPGRTYAARVGRWGRDSAHWEWVSPSQIPQIPKSAARGASLPGNPAGVTPTPNLPHLPHPCLSPPHGPARLSAVVAGPTSTAAAVESPPQEWRDLASVAPVQRTAGPCRTHGAPACFIRTKVRETRQGADCSKRPSPPRPAFLKYSTCLGSPL